MAAEGATGTDGRTPHPDSHDSAGRTAAWRARRPAARRGRTAAGRRSAAGWAMVPPTFWPIRSCAKPATASTGMPRVRARCAAWPTSTRRSRAQVAADGRGTARRHPRAGRASAGLVGQRGSAADRPLARSSPRVRPSDDFVYVVDGEPVIVAWGYEADAAAEPACRRTAAGAAAARPRAGARSVRQRAGRAPAGPTRLGALAQRPAVRPAASAPAAASPRGCCAPARRSIRALTIATFETPAPPAPEAPPDPTPLLKASLDDATGRRQASSRPRARRPRRPTSRTRWSSASRSSRPSRHRRRRRQGAATAAAAAATTAAAGGRAAGAAGQPAAAGAAAVQLVGRFGRRGRDAQSPLSRRETGICRHQLQPLRQARRHQGRLSRPGASPAPAGRAAAAADSASTGDRSPGIIRSMSS